jgi:hypothetical protein
VRRGERLLLLVAAQEVLHEHAQLGIGALALEERRPGLARQVGRALEELLDPLNRLGHRGTVRRRDARTSTDSRRVSGATSQVVSPASVERTLTASPQRLAQPDADEAPLALDRPGRETKRRGRLLDESPAK